MDACSLITTDEVATVLQAARPDDSGFEVTTESVVVGQLTEQAPVGLLEIAAGRL